MENMTTIVRAECATLPRERAFASWLAKLQASLGAEIDPDDREGIAWDLFADGATPEEAADEIRANAARQRHTANIVSYVAAVERVGFDAVERVIGGTAAGKLELARDAAHRQQNPSIVAGYLAKAQSRFDSRAGDDAPDLYATLASI